MNFQEHPQCNSVNRTTQGAAPLSMTALRTSVDNVKLSTQCGKKNHSLRKQQLQIPCQENTPHGGDSGHDKQQNKLMDFWFLVVTKANEVLQVFFPLKTQCAVVMNQDSQLVPSRPNSLCVST